MLKLLERARERQVGVPAPAQHRLHQHHPARARAVVPGRRGHRAPHPRLHPLERRDHGVAGEQDGRRRRPHRHLRQRRVALRGRLQPLLPRQGPRQSGIGRPGLLPGPRRAGHLRARVPRGPADRAAPRRLPAGEVARAVRAVVLPAPAAHAGVLGVPDRVDGPRPDRRDLPGPVQPLPARARAGRHVQLARLGLPRRRRDGRGRVARRDRRGRARGARQPDLRHQLQPAAPRRPGARQRQDHPGAGVLLPRRRLERHQGRLGTRLGPAARPRRRRRARQPDEPDAGRAVPDLHRRDRRLHPRALLRRRPAAAQDGRGHVRRRPAQALARRPRLPQGVRRVRGGARARRAADGDPGQDDQGLDARVLRGPQRHPPDEEADQGRPQGVPRPALPADLGRGARRRPAAVLPPGREVRRDPVHEGAPRRARRRVAEAGRARQAADAARRRGLRRTAGRLGQAAGRHHDGDRPAVQGPDEGQGDRHAVRADHPGRGAHLRPRRDLPDRQDLLAARAGVRGRRPRAAAVVQGVDDRADPARGHLRGRLDGLADRGRHVVRDARRRR